jgi:hypothetical protein
MASSYLFTEIGNILKRNPVDINGVRIALKKSKDQHKVTGTRELNDAYKIPRHRFIKRDGILT